MGAALPPGPAQLRLRRPQGVSGNPGGAEGPSRCWTPAGVGAPLRDPCGSYPCRGTPPAGPGAVAERAPSHHAAIPPLVEPDRARFGATLAATSRPGKPGKPGKRGKRGSARARPWPSAPAALQRGERRGAAGARAGLGPGTCRRVSAPTCSGLCQAGWAGVTGLFTAILFISLAASPELCLQRGLVVPVVPAFCLDRGLL